MTFALDSAALDLLFGEAHTAYTFAEEPVSDEQIQAVYDLIKLAPTAYNQSPMRIILVRSAEARERLVSHMSDGNKERTGKAPLTAIIATDNEFHQELPVLFPQFPQAKDVVFAERPVRERSAQLNGALQAAYFILGIRAAGLAAGPMNGFDATGIQKEFLDDNHTPLMVINIGRPGEDAFRPRSPRLPHDRVITVI